jgi:hypothetical protein
MNIERICPECGKLMVEEKKWPGLFVCPDNKIRLNDSPPFRFKCTGMEVTDEAVEQFDRAIWKLYVERN